MPVKLSLLLKPELVFLAVPAHTREEVLVFVADRLAQAGVVRYASDLVDLLLDRERLGATVVGDEIAIPHCKVPGLKSIVVAFARLSEAIPFGPDQELARLFFFVLSPHEQPAAHLQVLANISRVLRNPLAQAAFQRAATVEELDQALQRLGSA
ncbi:MAG: PTS sugar transporter subunit IIA [Acidobacteria bacterium]|nr:PTS sugar transporter subunit IIA [Acidobacteriota bacterium]